MNAENINEAIILLDEYQMLNEIYQRATKINAEVCDLAREYEKAKCDLERMTIADEIDKKIERIFVADKRINLSVKCDIYLHGFGQAINNLESKIECLISNIEDL